MRAAAGASKYVEHRATEGHRRESHLTHQENLGAMKTTAPKKNRSTYTRMHVGLLRLLTGVPTGIRTPVLTVKG